MVFLAIRPDGTKSFSTLTQNPFTFGNVKDNLAMIIDNKLLQYEQIAMEIDNTLLERAKKEPIDYEFEFDELIMKKHLTTAST